MKLRFSQMIEDRYNVLDGGILSIIVVVIGNVAQSLIDLPSDLDSAKMPRHIAVIMDVNGRWAKQRSLPRILGHQRGVDTLKDLLRC